MLVLANNETTRNLTQSPFAGKGPGSSSDEQVISKRNGSLLFDGLFHVNQEKYMSGSFKIKFSKFPDRS